MILLKKNLIDLKKYGSPDLVSFFQNMADCVNLKKIVADYDNLTKKMLLLTLNTSVFSKQT